MESQVDVVLDLVKYGATSERRGTLGGGGGKEKGRGGEREGGREGGRKGGRERRREPKGPFVLGRKGGREKQIA